MIPYDENWTFDPDCSTCKHRVRRHPSKHSTPSKPRRCEYVCLVTARAIGEHGNFMHTVMREDGSRAFGGPERWIQDVPCKCNMRDGKGWFALDYEPIEDNDESKA